MAISSSGSSTEPIRSITVVFLTFLPFRDQNRNSRLISTPGSNNGLAPGKQATDQLDELAKQLQDLVPSPGPARAGDKSRNQQQRVSSGN